MQEPGIHQYNCPHCQDGKCECLCPVCRPDLTETQALPALPEWEIDFDYLYSDNTTIGACKLRLKAFISKLQSDTEAKTKQKTLDDVEHLLGMWVSSEYRVEHYDDKNISPRDFWHEWTKIKESLN